MFGEAGEGGFDRWSFDGDAGNAFGGGADLAEGDSRSATLKLSITECA